MAKTFGNFVEEPAKSQEYLIVGFSPSSVPLKQRWQTNGLSADFLAAYLATFFPTDDETAVETLTKAEITGAISYIANELLENAMKFSDPACEYPISISLHLYPDRLVFMAKNSVVPQTVEPFQRFLEKVIVSDPSDLYIQQLEANALSESGSESGLGLLTMMSDYGAELSWKFEVDAENGTTTTVTTRVQLML